jgi:hypothetical protein
MLSPLEVVCTEDPDLANCGRGAHQPGAWHVEISSRMYTFIAIQGRDACVAKSAVAFVLCLSWRRMRGVLWFDAWSVVESCMMDQLLVSW